MDCHRKAARSDCTFKAARISWAITHPAISRGSQACPEGCHTSSTGGSGPAAVTAVMAPLRARARRSMGRCLLSWTKATCVTVTAIVTVTVFVTVTVLVAVAVMVTVTVTITFTVAVAVADYGLS